MLSLIFVFADPCISLFFGVKNSLKHSWYILHSTIYLKGVIKNYYVKILLIQKEWFICILVMVSTVSPVSTFKQTDLFELISLNNWFAGLTWSTDKINREWNGLKVGWTARLKRWSWKKYIRQNTHLGMYRLYLHI